MRTCNRVTADLASKSGGTLGVTISLIALCGCFGQVETLTVEAPSCQSGSPCSVVRKVDAARFTVTGTGVCKLVRLNYGDGSIDEIQDHDFDKGPWIVTHTFTGYPGDKSVRAQGITNCTGTTNNVPIKVFKNAQQEIVWSIGLNEPYIDPTNCFNVPDGATAQMPVLRPGTQVTVIGSATPMMEFGCFGGCAFGPNGRSTIASPPNPFPGMRESSLVLRVGTQMAQGGTTASSFVTTGSGRLELCINDNRVSDNHGGWRIDVLVNEFAAP
jgi:hypothetical protein